MEYRKYRAKTFQEAKLKMLLDVGNKAYIISQKRMKEGGFLGFFGKPVVEITAGVIEQAPLKKVHDNSRIQPELNNDYYEPEPRQQQNQTNNYSNFQQEKEESSIREELNELKSLMAKILENKLNPPANNPIQEQNGHNRQPDSNSPVEKTKDIIKMFLKNEDFDENFINTLCSLSNIEMGLAGETNLDRIKGELKKQIFQAVEITKGISIDPTQMNIIALVGPTGVGKTTTLAKLGAYFGVFQKKRVKFISIDTYRVGAIQQLKLYADIMEIPFAKVNSIEELKMEAYADKYDIVLIDTTGRSQKNLDEIRDIKNYIEILQGKVHLSLCVSATTKYKDLVEILDKFDILNYSSIIVTKLDETNTLGQVISAIGPKKRSLAYITFGQSVPEDIEEASKEKLYEMVLKA